jgi:hypothetical protein
LEFSHLACQNLLRFFLVHDCWPGGPPTFCNAGVNRMEPKKKPRRTTRGWNSGAGTEKR